VNTIKQLANKSVYGTIGYIGSQQDLELLEQYILYNLPVLNEFKQIVVATNYNSYSELIKKNELIWKKYFSGCILFTSEVNRGPAFGTADLDNIVFNYCVDNKIEWLFKSSNDVLIQESFLNKEIPEADFYYLNGISYEDLHLNNFDYEIIIDKKFFPQTNGYFIKVSKCDYLVTKEFLDKTYSQVISIPEYSGKPWEYIKNWSCELFLKDCVERNNLTKYYLLNIKDHNQLCEIINTYKIGDPSHKNIMIDGMCHLQYPEQTIILL
jgi:hypothetical protein